MPSDPKIPGSARSTNNGDKTSTAKTVSKRSASYDGETTKNKGKRKRKLSEKSGTDSSDGQVSVINETSTPRPGNLVTEESNPDCLMTLDATAAGDYLAALAASPDEVTSVARTPGEVQVCDGVTPYGVALLSSYAVALGEQEDDENLVSSTSGDVVVRGCATTLGGEESEVCCEIKIC